MVCGGGAFGRYLGHEDGAVMNGIGTLIRADQRASFLFSHHMKIQEEVESLQPERWLSPERNGINF